MKRDIAEKWIAALRSGKYKQAKGRLVRFESDSIHSEPELSYCCLGVLAYQVLGYPIPTVLNVPQHLKLDMQMDAGLISQDGNLGIYTEGVGMDSLARMNDRGFTFAEIADVIAKHRENL